MVHQRVNSFKSKDIFFKNNGSGEKMDEPWPPSGDPELKIFITGTGVWEDHPKDSNG